MDRPLLALTRPLAAPVGPSEDSVATDNMRQLIQLRWLAVIGQVVTIVAVRFGFGVALPLQTLLVVVATLAAANLVSLFLLRRHRVTDAEMLLALLFDVGALTVQLLLTGGSSNPFTSLLLVQVVLGAILLKARSVWVLVAAACLCFAGLTVRPVPLVFPPGLLPEIGDLYTVGNWLGFTLTCTLLVLFSTRISRNLRARDAFVAELREHAAEEENIVRMGLFASGAAHELGTPLSTLSVILGDWQTLPRIVRDPELAGEVAEMQAEVRRCKTIVSDILRAAGEPRNEALGREALGLGTPGRMDAGAFLDEVVEGWRGHGHDPVPLDYARDDLAGAMLVADPALRQAIGNLLDNAAEASPGGISLRGTKGVDGLEVTIRDDGPGFAADRLAHLGQPCQSSKGEGHGVGLFLAFNVARRMGGRVEARNRLHGGALVRLVVPVMRDIVPGDAG